jgi:hypothetical protein
MAQEAEAASLSAKRSSRHTFPFLCSFNRKPLLSYLRLLEVDTLTSFNLAYGLNFLAKGKLAEYNNTTRSLRLHVLCFDVTFAQA